MSTVFKNENDEQLEENTTVHTLSWFCKYETLTLNKEGFGEIINNISKQVESLREEADKAKKECLAVKQLAEEKAMLMKQEQTALRKVIFMTFQVECCHYYLSLTVS